MLYPYCLLNYRPSELNTNEEMNRKAREQAGIENGNRFKLSDFSYNVSVVPNLTKAYLENICFDGKSVQYLVT